MRKVLILDKNDDLLFAMQRLLSFYKFSVRTIQDYNNLLYEIGSFKPEIIIIDVLLGGKDGRLICKALREDPSNQAITLMLFSASSKHLEDFEQYNADGIIEKPFEINDLIKRIEAAVQSRRQYLDRLRSSI